MSTEDYFDILKKAEQEGESIEKASFGSNGCVERRRKGSVRYSREIGEFLFFMRNSIRPSGLSDAEFLNYKPVVKALVDKKQLDSEALKEFDGLG